MLTAKHLIILALLCFQGHAWRKVSVQILNISYDYSKNLGYMNATLSEGGALSVFLRPSVDINQAFLTVVLTFSTDDRNFDIHYLNKTVDFCQLSSKPRYEPFIKLGYKIVSEKVHLPQHCPIKKNDSFLTTNYTFVTDQLPPVFPATKILFYTAYSLLKNGTLHKIFDLKVTGHVRHRN